MHIKSVWLMLILNDILYLTTFCRSKERINLFNQLKSKYEKPVRN